MSSIDDKRESPRMPANYDVFLRFGDRSHNCRTRDISITGVGLSTAEELSPDGPVEMSIFIPDYNINFQAKGVIKHCTRVNGNFAVGIEFTEGHEKGLPFLEDDTSEGEFSISTSVSIQADIDTCYLLVNPENFPEWVSGVEEAAAVDYHPDGRPRRVEFLHNFLIRKVRYIDNFSWDDDSHTLSWVSEGGDKDLVSNVGGYSFKPLGKDQTLMTWSADIRIAFIPSRRLVNYFSTILVRKEMKNYKKYVESRAGN